MLPIVQRGQVRPRGADTISDVSAVADLIAG